jgi:hypothetical protein
VRSHGSDGRGELRALMQAGALQRQTNRGVPPPPVLRHPPRVASPRSPCPGARKGQAPVLPLQPDGTIRGGARPRPLPLRRSHARQRTGTSGSKKVSLSFAG